MNQATADMIGATGTNLCKLITDLYIRIENLETDNTRFANAFHDMAGSIQKVQEVVGNTLANSPQILENLNDRMQRLEDKFDQLNGGNDEHIRSICEGVLENSEVIDHMFDTRLQASGVIDAKVDAGVKEWMNNNFVDHFDDRKDNLDLQDESDVDSAIERAMEDFDVGDKVDEYLRYNKDVIREIIKDMTFTVEVD